MKLAMGNQNDTYKCFDKSGGEPWIPSITNTAIKHEGHISLMHVNKDASIFEPVRSPRKLLL